MPWRPLLARDAARTRSRIRALARARRAWPLACAVAIVAAVTTSFGATSGTVVTATIPSALSITNSCTSTTATAFGTVTPGSGATTDTGAGKCVVSWSASNNSSMLRIAQRDGTGTAMSRPSSLSANVDWSVWTTVNSADGVNAIAGGNSGAFGRTDNSGATWTVTNNLGGNTFEINRVEQVPGDPTGAWAVGFGERVQRVTNALGVPAVTDRRATLEASGWPNGLDVQTVAVVDVDTAFVGGDSGWVAKTDNDGASWTSFQIPATSEVRAMSISSTGHVWMATKGNGGGNIWRAPVGGGTTLAGWTQYNTAVGSTINSVIVTSATQGYAVGSTGALLSWDGSNWTWRGSGPLEPGNFTDVNSPNGAPDTAIAVGDDGSIIRTTNSGVDWSRIYSPVGTSFGGVASGTGGMLAVGVARSSITSTDGAGATWTFQSDVATARARRGVALEPVDGNIALAVGSRGTIWRSTDGGGTWGTVTSGTSEALYGVAWASRTLAWAVGSNGTIRRSDDAGLTWTTVTSGTNLRLLSVSAGAAEQVTIVGDGGIMMRSSNGGTSFTTSTLLAGQMLRDVSMASRLVGVIVGPNFVRRTSDGGATRVAPTTAPAAEFLMGVSMADTSTGYATAIWQGIWKTTNGGDTWTRQTIGSGTGFDIHAVTPTVVFTVGDQIWMTTNGTTWAGQANPSWPKVAVAASDANHLIVGGEVGGWAVRRASTAGADQIPDYGVAPNSWAASAQAMFGVCLQAVGAQTAQAAPWVVDGGTCTQSDTDPWRALPITPTKIAGVAVSGNSGQVDLVWGVRFPDTQAPGTYTAGVVFETVAPNA